MFLKTNFFVNTALLSADDALIRTSLAVLTVSNNTKPTLSMMLLRTSSADTAFDDITEDTTEDTMYDALEDDFVGEIYHCELRQVCSVDSALENKHVEDLVILV